MNPNEAELPPSQPAEPASACVCPDVLSAATDAVHRAQAELKKAQEFYEDIRRRAAGQVEVIRNKKVGDLVDGTLSLVKKHPGPGLLIAAVAGVMLGRLFKR